jgi:hypothetical protein
MKNLIRTGIFIGIILELMLLAGCGGGKIIRKTLSQPVNAPRDDIYKVAMYVLRTNGYPIAFADKTGGRISTRERDMRLTKEDCTCKGLKMSKGAQNTREVKAAVTLFVTFADSSFSVGSVIIGNNRENMADANSLVECSSTGKLEKELTTKISDGIHDFILDRRFSTPRETDSDDSGE